MLKTLVMRGVLISLLLVLYAPLGKRWSVTATIDAFGVPVCAGAHRPFVNSPLRSAA